MSFMSPRHHLFERGIDRSSFSSHPQEFFHGDETFNAITVASRQQKSNILAISPYRHRDTGLNCIKQFHQSLARFRYLNFAHSYGST